MGGKKCSRVLALVETITHTPGVLQRLCSGDKHSPRVGSLGTLLNIFLCCPFELRFLAGTQSVFNTGSRNWFFPQRYLLVCPYSEDTWKSSKIVEKLRQRSKHNSQLPEVLWKFLRNRNMMAQTVSHPTARKVHSLLSSCSGAWKTSHLYDDF